MSTARDVISIRGLKVDCVVGIYPHERDRVQPLEVDVHMALDTGRAGERERLAHTIDYAATANQIAFLLQSCEFFMLEAAARALTRWLLAPPAPGARRPRAQHATVRLTKPDALGGHGIPSVEITRDSSEVTLAHEDKPWGTVDIVDETRTVGIYRLNLRPGGAIPLHLHREMQESELVLGDGLLCQGRAVAAGRWFRWPKDAAHRYDNPTDRWQSILCVDSPPFIPADEVPQDEGVALADVEPHPPLIPMRTGT